MAAKRSCGAYLRALEQRPIPCRWIHRAYRNASLHQPGLRSFSNSPITAALPQTQSASNYEEPPAAKFPLQSQATPTPSATVPANRPSSARFKVAEELQRRAPSSITHAYAAYALTEKLFKECARQAEYDIPQVREKGGVVPKAAGGEDLGVGEGWWYTDLELKPTFNTWAQITLLHMYILTVRFRLFPASYVNMWNQHLTDHFFFDAEFKMEYLHGLTSKSIRDRYLKDLFVQWRGMQAAYDEGFVRGDAVLATAVWRNIFKASEEVDAVGVAQVVAFIRREISRVDQMADQEVVDGGWKFETPQVERNLVLMQSRLMKEPFVQEL